MLIEKAPLAGGAFSELPLHDRAGNSENCPPRQNNQVGFEAEFDADIALDLAASGWRSTAALLTHAVKCIEAGDFLNAERNRQRARGLFIEGNDAFRQFMEARAAKAAAEAYQ